MKKMKFDVIQQNYPLIFSKFAVDEFHFFTFRNN